LFCTQQTTPTVHCEQCFVSVSAVRICLSARHLWFVTVTESEPDVSVSRHVDGNDRVSVEGGV
jgi:hypothetical protein